MWFAIGGAAHFALTEVEMRIVPPAIPWPRAAVLVSGVFELLGAAGILIPATRHAAGVGLFLRHHYGHAGQRLLACACRIVQRSGLGADTSAGFPSCAAGADSMEHLGAAPAGHHVDTPRAITYDRIMAPKLTGLSGNEIYCMRLKGTYPERRGNRQQYSVDGLSWRRSFGLPRHRGRRDSRCGRR